MTPRDEQNAASSDRAVCRARPKFPAATVRSAAFRRLPPPITDIWDWQLRGACRGLDGGLFFHPERERGPARAVREARAKHVCGTCPVMAQCRRHALSAREPYGVWGGLSESDRAALADLRNRPLSVAPPAPSTRPVELPPAPGSARNNRAGSGNAECDSPQAGVLELVVPQGGAELRLVSGAPTAVAVMASGRRRYPGAAATAGARAAAAPGARTLICGSREEPQEQLTVVEVAAMLRVSRATVYRLVHAGHLPGMRVGRSIRVAREAVEKYMRDAALGGDHT